MQARADLGLLQLAEVAIGGLEPLEPDFVASGSPVSAFRAPRGTGRLQLRGQLELVEALKQLLLQLATARRPQFAGLPVLIEQGLQFQQGPIQAGPAQGGSEVVEDHGLAAPFGLGALARIVNDEGIEMGHRPQGPLREAVGREPQALAGQPFQIAVLAHVADQLHPGLLAQPEVAGQVGVGGRQIGAVVVKAGIPVVAPLRLQQQPHLAELDPSHWKPLGREAGIGLRRSPAPLQGLATL